MAGHSSRIRVALIGAALLSSGSALAQGGPPLLTDDPGTPDKATWEINLAWTGSETRCRRETELPTLDLNYGLTERIQLTAESPWVSAREAGETESGIGNGEFAVKWRFQDAKGCRPAVSIFPRVIVNLSSRSSRLGLSDPGTAFLFPAQVQWNLKHIGINADAGVLAEPGEGPGWIGGVAVGTTVHGNELLAELHGEGRLGSAEREWITQIGLRHELTERAIFILALGKTVDSHGVEPSRWRAYVGVQLKF
jgi:hypothetical protein